MYQITTSNACFGLVVRDGRITEAAPIGRRLIGRPWPEIEAQYRQKGATVVLVGEPARNTSVWVRDRKTKAIVGYITPDRRLVRLANASILYAMAMKRRRTGEEHRHDE